MTNPVIYKLDRYRHRGELPLCRNCRKKRSSGNTFNGALACVVCQDALDVFIRDNFDVRTQAELVKILQGASNDN